ncbi:hypothetical protein HMPREF1983_00627 [Gemella bergeri ATCC 700627]|uniref:DUF1634 domain-containing protein n=1 Tax=Gemella bergeri ATCC 700627 TaxID=1321820 RepID=U2QS16_9BACL|nr:DUF1634 domain-containing protein [Gemella bergeri]ERK58989.1 hypothetical protein HMPREF1983_00627 [Gemella bergeri ATCC 700627]
MNKKKDINIIISNILKLGVYTSSLFIILGITLAFTTHSDGRLVIEHYTFIEMLKGLLKFDYYAYLMCGIFVLILTPVLRILGLLVIYYTEKDYKFVKVCIIVLIILCISLTLGVKHN